MSLHVTRDDFYAYAVVEGDAELAPVAAAPDDATVDELVEYYRAVAGEHPDWDELPPGDGRRPAASSSASAPTHAYGMLPDLTRRGFRF